MKIRLIPRPAFDATGGRAPVYPYRDILATLGTEQAVLIAGDHARIISAIGKVVRRRGYRFRHRREKTGVAVWVEPRTKRTGGGVMRYRLTRAEQETVLRWDREGEEVSVWSADPVTWRRMAKLGIAPIRETRFREGGVVSGRFYRVSLSRFRWGLKRGGPRQNPPRTGQAPRLAGRFGRSSGATDPGPGLAGTPAGIPA